MAEVAERIVMGRLDRAVRWLVGWVGLRLMDWGERIEMLGDDLLGWSEAERTKEGT